MPELSARARQDADSSSADPADAALVKRLLDGNEAAFNGLVEQYHGRLLRLALAFVSDRASAEEVVQDTWLAVLTGLRSFQGRSALKTWIFSILTNRAKTRGQRDKRTVPFSALSGQHSQEDPAVSPSRFTPSGRWSAPPEQWDRDKVDTPYGPCWHRYNHDGYHDRGRDLAGVHRRRRGTLPGVRRVSDANDPGTVSFPPPRATETRRHGEGYF